MAFGSAYSEITGRQERHEKREERNPSVTQSSTSPSEQASSVQSKVNWLKDPVTVEMMKDLHNNIKDLRDKATHLAVTYFKHQNHIAIVQLLVETATLEEIVNTYGRIHKSNPTA